MFFPRSGSANFSNHTCVKSRVMPLLDRYQRNDPAVVDIENIAMQKGRVFGLL